MLRCLACIGLFLLTACSASPQGSVAPATQTPSRAPAVPAPAPAARPAPVAVHLPSQACAREGYEAFFEAFVREPGHRAALALPGAPVADLDIAMRDYSWVLASKPDTLLDIDEHRSGDEFSVSAKPVERNEDDEVVKVLGPTRTYTFRYVNGCWKFASVQ
ncbi:hypothetical protein [Cognatilysobacter terrigena]|uniref:hypothetical protein n=1 Tax=Cognatilysobacter terrigena TaxID=2488749 RepID=UPI001AACD4E0|nr:hypothetical protein [Lysobacter terrigena]